MGVSFKVARVGARYKPKQLPIENKDADTNASANDSEQRSVEGKFSQIGAEIVDDSERKDKNVQHSTLEELEVSFSLNLFKDGFSIGKAIEFLSDIPKQLLPYDKASEPLLSAIEYGWLPEEILDAIPCKYVNGALMCEIRDYRNILLYEEGQTSPTGNAPIVHKMILRLSMETIVKDILSISNDSWTYKDRLEIESCIIKALQPDLHLNPEPIRDTFFGEPPRKKLDLGIAWSWKKRKLSAEPTHSLPLRNSDLVNIAQDDCLIQKSKPLPGPLEKGRSASSVQEGISSRFCDQHGNNHTLDYTSPSYAAVVLKTPIVVSVPNQLFTDVNTATPGNAIVHSEKGVCDKQAFERLPFKKPKKEPVELPKLHLVGSQVDVTPQGPEVQGRDNTLQEQLKFDKVPCENRRSKLHFSQSIREDQMVLKRVQNQLTVASSVKQEPADTSDLHTDYRCMNSGRDPSNLNNSNQKLSLKPLRINSSSIHTSNQMAQPSVKYLKIGTATQKRKDSQNSHVTAADGSLSQTPQNSNSLQRRTFTSAGQKNSRSKVLRTEMVDSVVSMTHAKVPTVENLSLPKPLVEVNVAVDRFLKIQRISERYGLVNKKRKFDQIALKRPFFSQTPPLVGFHLASFEDNGQSEDSGRYHRKTRTLIFSHESHIILRSDRPVVDKEALIKLVLLENVEMGTVEVGVYYGYEGESWISFPLLPTFPSSLHFANQFASQFASLMVREGYCIISDHVGSVPCNTDSGPNIEKRLVGSNAILTSGRVQPPSATWTAGPSSPPLQNSLSNRMQLHDSAQSRLQNILSGVNFTMSGNSRSLPQPSHNLMQQVRSMQQWWQQGANKLSLLQYQVQLLRQRQEQELHSRLNLGASAIGRDIVPFNDRIQGIRNIDLGSSSHSNITGNNGSAPILSGGIVHWPNTLNSCNNLENEHMSGLNDKQLFGALSDHRLAALPKLNASQDLEGRGLICGLPTQRIANLSAVTAKPDALDMRNVRQSSRDPSRDKPAIAYGAATGN